MATVLAPDPVYTATDAGRVLNVTESYVHRCVRDGLATPSVPVGNPPRRHLFTRADIEALGQRLGRPLRFPDRPDLGPEAG